MLQRAKSMVTTRANPVGTSCEEQDAYRSLVVGQLTDLSEDLKAAHHLAKNDMFPIALRGRGQGKEELTAQARTAAQCPISLIVLGLQPLQDWENPAG